MDESNRVKAESGIKHNCHDCKYLYFDDKSGKRMCKKTKDEIRHIRYCCVYYSTNRKKIVKEK